MKAFLIGVAAVVVISVGAMLVFENGFDFSAGNVYRTDSVRMD